MWALYAFSRRTDDLGDSQESAAARRASLVGWQGSLERALAGAFDSPLWPALMDAVRRYEIPHQYLLDIVQGVSWDVEPARFETFADLRRYCYLVASAVGLACIHVWGFEDQRACLLADRCGVALQITNILRDLKEDVMRGRVYLPVEDLRRFDYTEDDLCRGVMDARYRALMDFQIDRAERLFDESQEILGMLHIDGRATCAAMLATYRQLLVQIRRRDGDVFSRPVHLSPIRKLSITCRALIGSRWLSHRAPATGALAPLSTPRGSPDAAPSGSLVDDKGHS
jgi:phytoene synthase